MSEHRPPHDEHREQHLIDVTPILGTNWLAIYDLTLFFRSSNTRDRESYMDLATHTVRGKTAVVHIIDHYEVLDDDKATTLAVKWKTGQTYLYRLD